MNRRSFLRGAAALPVAAVVPVKTAAPATAGFELVMGPALTGPFQYVTLYEDQRAIIKRWDFDATITTNLQIGDDDMSERDARGPEEHERDRSRALPAHDPSVPMTGHLPSDDAGEEEELDADATTERDATIEADATGAGGGGLVQLAREPADTRGRERGTPCRSSLLPSEAGEVSASYADGGVESPSRVAHERIDPRLMTPPSPKTATPPRLRQGGEDQTAGRGG